MRSVPPQPVKRYEKVPTTFGNTQAQTRIAPVTTATHPVVKYVTSMSRSRHKQLESTAATYLRFATWASNFSVSRQATRDGFLRKLDRTAHLGYYLATRQCRPDRSEIALSLACIACCHSIGISSASCIGYLSVAWKRMLPTAMATSSHPMTVLSKVACVRKHQA